jgi:hypothetical protein
MKFQRFTFGSLKIDDVTYEKDVVIDRGKVRRRKKKASRKYRDMFGHTPLSNEERIPWHCRQLVVGLGKYGSLPVMEEVKEEARRRNVDLIVLPTDDAIKLLRKEPAKTNAVLHLTC